MHYLEHCNYGQGGIKIRKFCIMIIIPGFINCEMHLILKRIQVFKKGLRKKEFYNAFSLA